MSGLPATKQLSRAAGVLALAGYATACGARSWLPSDPRWEDGGTCVGTDVPIVPNVPNLYFVLDVSGSMLDNGKWGNVRTAVADLVREIGANANFGVTVFPEPGASECTAGIEVMPLRPGDWGGATQAAFIAATALTPNGGTPTAATFHSLVHKLAALPSLTFVILATDGGPNCDAAIQPCTVDQCTTNIDGTNTLQCPPGGPANCCTGNPEGCLDGDATAQAVSDLRTAGVQTYVMGIPGSAPYAAVLDQLATAGGTARPSEPLYYQVDSPDTNALSDAFEQIADAVMKSCTLLLEKNPGDPNMVNVAVNGTVIPSDGPDGWTLHGQTVTLSGASCGAFEGAASLPVRISQGCPTVR
ncbi:MAG: vWA domain-containing protein [Polyangiaceae bacterium]